MINTLKKTALVSSLTLISRVLGLIRDVLIALFFGISPQSDAFFIAFRPFDFMRKMFSDGILNISFIPIFSKILVKDGKSKAAALLFSFFCFLTIAGAVMMLLGVYFAPLIVKIIAPGFALISYESQLTIILFKIMLPYLWLILMSSLCMGVLNTFGNFGIPGFAPVVFNLVIILFTLIITNYFDTPVMGLALGVTIGGLLQLAIQVPFIMRLGILKKSGFTGFYSGLRPEVIKILKIMIPSTIGVASYQINIMTASFFASKLDTGSISYLYYADRLVQFPLALFAVSTAMVLLPDLSKKTVAGQIHKIEHLFSNAVRLVLFVTMPAMAGLMALDEQIVALLFNYGAFSDPVVHHTSNCLFFLSMGLWAFTGSRLLVTLYYSLSNISIPFYSGILTIGLNLIFSFLLMDSLGLKGLVLSVSLSAAIGFVVLLINVPGVVNIDKYEIIVSACRSLFFSAIMFFLVQLAADLILIPGINKFWFGAGVIICIGLGIGSYFVLNLLISSPELKMLKKGMARNRS